MILYHITYTRQPRPVVGWRMPTFLLLCQAFLHWTERKFPHSRTVDGVILSSWFGHLELQWKKDGDR